MAISSPATRSSSPVGRFRGKQRRLRLQGTLHVREHRTECGKARAPLRSAGGDRDRCTISLTFDTAITGILVYACDNGDTGTSGWRIEDVPEPDTEPDLTVESLTASNRSPDTRETVTLTATVRNQGDRRSAGTTLRYYRSSNPQVSTSDTEVGTSLVGSLEPSGESEVSTRMRAPSSGGLFYIGACVDPVSGESDTDDNCADVELVVVFGEDG